jgi:CRISPR-associated endonuclease/helicase Cas3
MNFPEFFHAATGNGPYDWQRRLARGDKLEGEAPSEPIPCQSRLINIPTGLGKTAGVVLAWLWNRIGAQLENPKSKFENPPLPRRLVYCLPMRTLVEQTRDEATKWIAGLSEKGFIAGKPPRVVVLMGGEELDDDSKDWDIYPEEDTILIGTQDMLISRALNRGYGMSRYRWPMHFGLLFLQHRQFLIEKPK